MDPNKDRAPAEFHMQNLVSWAPFLEMGRRPGRTMVRAYGGHIDGPQDIPANVYENLQKFAPDIFDIDNWTDFRIDTIDYLLDLEKKRDSGELTITPIEN